MENIIQIKGNVKFQITLDPSVWIFDDRKVSMDEFFQKETLTVRKSEDDYTQKISQYWEREIREGSISPPTLETEKMFEKEKLLTGTYCMPLEPFLINAEMSENVKFLIIQTKDGDVKIPIEKGKELMLAFSKDGKPLTEDGPIHCYFGDGTNLESPIKNVTAFVLE